MSTREPTTAELTLNALFINFRDELIAEIKKLAVTRETPWMTVDEAAVYARCSKRTLQRVLAAGELQAGQNGTGGTYTIHVDDLDAWLKTRGR